MIFIHLLLLLGGYFLGRARTEFRGAAATTDSGLDYTFEVDRYRGNVTSRTFGVSAERLPMVGFWRERWTDRFFKFVHLVREFSCNDAEFDAKAFVACSNPAVRDALVRSAPLRQAVVRLLDAGAMLIECSGKTAWARFPATFDEDRTEDVVADLRALSDGVTGLVDGDAELQTNRVENALRGISTSAGALAVVGAMIMVFHDNYWLVDGYALFFKLFPASMLIWLAFLAAIVGLLAGRSARAHRLFATGVWAGVVVVPLALFIAARDVNVALDFSVAQAALLPIVNHKVARVKESRWSDQKTRHMYAVVQAPVPDHDPLDVEIDYALYMQVANGEIDRATVRWHVGILGAPWIESVELGAPHAATAKEGGATENDIAGRDAACTGGDLAACNLLGVCFDEGGKCTPLDPAKALLYFTKACDGDNPAACGNLGYCYAHGTCAQLEATKAFHLFEKGCKGADLFSCNHLGECHEYGKGTPLDPVAALAVYTKACEGGHAVACTNLGYCLQHGTCGSEDMTKARELFAKACDANVPVACNNLGQCYLHGTCADKDMAKAYELLSKACNTNIPAACGELGVCFETGSCAAKSLPQARYVYDKACAKGDWFSCDRLGGCCERGDCADKDAGEAASRYTTACDHGYAEGCLHLGHCREIGTCGPVDPEAAKLAYTKACDADEPQACGMLGACVGAGRCGLRDRVAAQALIAKACAGGAENFCAKK